MESRVSLLLCSACHSHLKSAVSQVWCVLRESVHLQSATATEGPIHNPPVEAFCNVIETLIWSYADPFEWIHHLSQLERINKWWFDATSYFEFVRLAYYPTKCGRK